MAKEEQPSSVQRRGIAFRMESPLESISSGKKAYHDHIDAMVECDVEELRKEYRHITRKIDEENSKK